RRLPTKCPYGTLRFAFFVSVIRIPACALSVTPHTRRNHPSLPVIPSLRGSPKRALVCDAAPGLLILFSCHPAPARDPFVLPPSRFLQISAFAMEPMQEGCNLEAV